MTNFISMSQKEPKKYEIVEQVRAKRLKQTDAARLTEVTDRTIRRWIGQVKKQGAAGLIHGSRGRASRRRVPEPERRRIAALIRSRYPDFGPTLAAEKIAEEFGIHHDPKTIRALMIAERLWTPAHDRRGAPRPVHRMWRERRSHPGELIQFDGSYHDWFEGRTGANETCLLAGIDDATGKIRHLSFALHEGVLPVMGFWTDYAGLNGLPHAIYLDRFSTYKMTQRVATENHDLKTQLERAMKTLGVELIFALSPQAKGRVERLFKTLQDRLVKELRLQQISNVHDANRFLAQKFVPAFNRRYGVAPRDPADVHRKLSVRELRDLPETLCRMETRSTQNDFTISFKGQWYQILPTPRLVIGPRDPVMIREYPDGSHSFSIRNRRIEIKSIPKRQPITHSLRMAVPLMVPA